MAFILRNSVERISNVLMNASTWAQASLLINRGGLDRRTEVVALSAFVASIHFACPMLSETGVSGFEAGNLEARVGGENCLVIPMHNTTTRRELTVSAKSTGQNLDRSGVLSYNEKSKENPKSIARLLAVSQSEAGAWLMALPTPSLGNLIDAEAHPISIALRLGDVICEPHKCRCGHMLHVYGLHGLCCQFSSVRWTEHTRVNKIIPRALATIDQPSIREPLGLARANGERPDGLTKVTWMKGRCMVWDFTCVDTLT